MEKKTISVHAFTVHLYTIAIAVLILLLLVLGLKYLHLKLAVHNFTKSAIWQQVNQHPTGTIDDYGIILASTIGKYPQSKPLYTEPLQLESYVTTLSQSLNRDIVVMDTNKKVLADTVASNMGSKYGMDQGNEIGMTIQDGKIRSFTETSQDYPKGLSEVVVPIKNDKDVTVGALLISQTQISQK